MKKFTAFAILIAFSISFLNAQTDKKNVVKIFPTSVLFGKTTLGYERVINENGSFTLNIGLPTGTNLESYAPSDTEEGLDIISGKLKGFVFMPGYRLNLSKKGAPLGFFLDTYLKYENFNFNVDGEFSDEGELYSSNIDATLSAFGGGFAFGTQCLISDVVSLELSFFGLEAKAGTFDLTWLDKSGEVDLDKVYDELESSLSDVPVIGNKVELTKTSNSVNANIKNQFMPGFRFAFSLGIAF